MKAEAEQKGLGREATEFAIGLQELVNAYHLLPADLQDRPMSDPAVQEKLEEILGGGSQLGVSPSHPVAAAIDPVKATDCALAIAGAASIAVPGAGAWKWIKAAGGVITIAEAVQEYLKSKSQDALIKALGKTVGNEVKKVLGIQSVIDSCQF